MSVTLTDLFDIEVQEAWRCLVRIPELVSGHLCLVWRCFEVSVNPSPFIIWVRAKGLGVANVRTHAVRGPGPCVVGHCH